MATESNPEEEFNKMFIEEKGVLKDHPNFLGKTGLDLLQAVEGVRNGLTEASRLADVAQEDSPDDEELKVKKARARAKLHAIMEVEEEARGGVQPDVLATHYGRNKIKWEAENKRTE